MSTSNGTATQRKTLSSQLDRLDDILDCLGDGLNEAVGDAVKDAVAEAVRVSVRETLQAVIQEVASNPEIIATFAKHIVPPESDATTAGDSRENVPSEQPVPRRWGARMWAWAGPMLCSKWETVQATAKAGFRSVGTLWQHRGSVVSLSGIGVTVGLISYVMGPIGSAILSGFGGISTAVLVVVAVALWRVCHFGQSVEQFV